MRTNNFGLVRLMAALQVMFFHVIFLFGIWSDHKDNLVFQLIHNLPGVPVFFSLSGYLLAGSVRGVSGLGWRRYAINRILRIYPGLWGAFLFTLFAVILMGRTESLWGRTDFWAWCVAQLTVYQTYFPSWMGGFGAGYINGPIWTIAVELQFYVFIAIYQIVSSGIARTVRANLLIAAVFVGSLSLACYFRTEGIEGAGLLSRVASRSVLPYLFFFFVGVFIRENEMHVAPFLRNRFFVWLALWLAYVFVAFSIMRSYEVLYFPDLGALLLYFTLVGLAFSFAFSFDGLSNRLIGDSDISYGVYLYHMIVANLVFYFVTTKGWQGALLAMVCSVIIAFVSWRLIEHPALRLKESFISAHRTT